MERPEDVMPGSIPNDPVYRSWQEEATLRSIASIDQDRLVAVGDRGTILVTEDAGRHWKLIASPTSANLRDVCFIGNTGWAVGGWIGKHTKSSYSVVLRSTDAGASWENVPAETLPRLIGIRVQGTQLLCWGDYSPQFGSSVFSSVDGGLTWQPMLSGISHAAAATGNKAGQIIAIDTIGRSVVSGQAPSTIVNPNLQIRTLHVTDSGWVAAGEGGELIASGDGSNWEDMSLPVHPSVRPLCDWNTIASQGNHLWVAGCPGSVVVHSSDSGRSWSVFPTGQSLPIFKLCFIDQFRGWAVGAQGTLLATRDGGRSWYAQRRQPARVSLLAFTSSTRSTPWAALVASVWDHKRCSAAITLQHSEPIERTDTTVSHEVLSQEAARQLGLTDYGVCDVTLDPGDLAQARLAMQILSWRPDVLLSAIESNDLLSEHSLPRSLTSAIQLAGSPDFQSVVQDLYLAPWKIQKLVGIAEAGRGDFSEQSQRVLRGPGLAIWDVLSTLPEADRNDSNQVTMRTLWSKSQSRAIQADLLGGIASDAETQMRGNVDSLGNYQLVMGRVHREKMLKQLLRDDRSATRHEHWLREFQFFAQSLPPREAPEVMKTMVEGLLQSQQWERGHSVLLWIVQSSFETDFVGWANLRLLRLYAQYLPPSPQSPDKDSKVTSVAFVEPWSNSPFQTNDGPDLQSVQPAVAQLNSASDSGDDSPVVTASGKQVVQSTRSEEFEAERSLSESWLKNAERIIRQYPALRYRPEVVMQMAACLRSSGHVASAQALLSEMADQPQIISWSQASKQELAILNHRYAEMKWSITAIRTSEPPLLDGILDDPCWTSQSTMQLVHLNRSNGPLSTIQWAYDDAYLFVGISCSRVVERKSPTVVQRRAYDADISSLDHVELMIDTNRDYTTTIELAVAENGLTYDRSEDSSTFNPKWYVQVVADPQQWRAELAIPLSELTNDPIRSESAWAVSARRIQPNAQPQSWSQLRTHQRLPQANGLLLFE